jgi:UDPglucose 6-dehydrogenase
MKITIAGHGSIGRYIESVFGRSHAISLYDPPLGHCDSSLLVDADFVFVCVPTPLRDDGSCDVTIVEQVVGIADPRIAIICESTLPVGTTDRLSEQYGKQIVFVPEYAGEDAEHPFRDPGRRTFFVYGGYEPAVSAVRDLFASIYPPNASHTIVAPRTAELAKYMENSFLALKVTFCNEFYDLCARLGTSYEDVREIWLKDWRIGPSHTRVTAERGYAGKCLPKDVAAICAIAREAGAPLELMEATQRANGRIRLAALGS